METRTLVAKASGGGDFEIAPAGPTPATCIDVVDLGLIKTNYNGQEKMMHKIEIYWTTPHMSADGTQQLSVRGRYTFSLHDKASLTKILTSWRGKPFSAAEKEGFDLEKLIGVSCLLNIVHNPVGDRTYANIESVMPLMAGTTSPAVPADYVRQIDRQESRDQRSPNFKGYDDAPSQQAAPQNQAAQQYQQGPPQTAAQATEDLYAPTADLPF